MIFRNFSPIMATKMYFCTDGLRYLLYVVIGLPKYTNLYINKRFQFDYFYLRTLFQDLVQSSLQPKTILKRMQMLLSKFCTIFIIHQTITISAASTDI